MATTLQLENTKQEAPSPCLGEEIIHMSERSHRTCLKTSLGLLFPPLKTHELIRIKEAGVNFDEDDFEVLRERLNSTLFMRFFAFFGMSLSVIACKIILSSLILICVHFFIGIDFRESIFTFIATALYICVLWIPSIVFVSVAGEAQHFTLKSFRHTNVMVFVQPGFLRNPHLKLVVYNTQPCQKHVSDLFHKAFLQHCPTAQLCESEWETKINIFVSLCIMHVARHIGMFPYAKLENSKTFRHAVLNSKKCICEIIEECVDLSVYPFKVEKVSLSRSAFSHSCIRLFIFRTINMRNITFHYDANDFVQAKQMW